MTLTIKHKFISLKPDGGDVTVVRPTNWNDIHAIQGAAKSIIANAAGTAGDMSDVLIGDSLYITAGGKLDVSGVSQIGFFPLSTAPTGWLKANGALISRTTYADLFARIGVTFGAGDGTTTFKLPDFRGYFLRAWADGAAQDSGRAINSLQTEMVGPHAHTGATATESAAHNHNIIGGTDAQGLHNHNNSGYTNLLLPIDNTRTSQGFDATVGEARIDTSAPMANAGNHAHNISFVSGTENQAHAHGFTTNNNSGTETRPNNYALLCCIRH